MFDLEEFLTSSDMDVNATDIRFRDMRSGEEYCRTIFRPGRTLSFANLAKEMATYGYALLWMNGEPSNIPGHMNWSDVFGKFIEGKTA